MSLLHYVPGGLKAVAQMTGGNIVGALAPTTRTPVAPPPSFPDGLSPPAFKTHLCKKYNTTEGCRFGDKCHFAHGEWELRKPTALSHHEDPRVMGQVHGKFGGGPCMEPIPDPASNAAAASFGASATAKISVDVSLAGAIIGKRAFIAGVANDNGYGWPVKSLAVAGAEILVGTWVPALNIFETS